MVVEIDLERGTRFLGKEPHVEIESGFSGDITKAGARGVGRLVGRVDGIVTARPPRQGDSGQDHDGRRDTDPGVVTAQRAGGLSWSRAVGCRVRVPLVGIGIVCLVHSYPSFSGCEITNQPDGA